MIDPTSVSGEKVRGSVPRSTDALEVSLMTSTLAEIEAHSAMKKIASKFPEDKCEDVYLKMKALWHKLRVLMIVEEITPTIATRAIELIESTQLNLRGADSIFLASIPREMISTGTIRFISCDKVQREVAEAMHIQVFPKK